MGAGLVPPREPEQKRAAYRLLTDFVGWLPMADGGEREAYLTADYNAVMIEHIARYPWLRDRAVFVGNRDDIVGDRFGPDLPRIGEWTEEHFDFPGYITGFDPRQFVDRLGGAVDGLLAQQVELDVDTLQRAAGRTFSDDERDEIRAQQQRAYRWTFLVSGLQHPNFVRIVGQLTTAGEGKLATAAEALAA